LSLRSSPGQTCDVPFPDEVAAVAVLPYDELWPGEYAELAGRLQGALRGLAVAIDHVGSTSVPGLAAKDVIDVQVQVHSLDEELLGAQFASIGWRCRREAWNRQELSDGQQCPRLVFAPPAGIRRSNVHVRVAGGRNVRFALLFRDFLRADDAAMTAWGAFKIRLAQDVTDLASYGQIKAPATQVLMRAAERWASETGWSPLPVSAPAPGPGRVRAQL
jgi:GrpB-like predicted nucleotidyltransferase (UPF0157 family)